MSKEESLEVRVGEKAGDGPPLGSDDVGLGTQLNELRSRALQELYPTIESKEERWEATRALRMLEDMYNERPGHLDALLRGPIQTVGKLYALTEAEIRYSGRRFTRAAWFGLNTILEHYGLPGIALPEEFSSGRRSALKTEEILQSKTVSPELRQILTTPLSLDTDIRDFLILVGWRGYRESSLYKAASRGLKREIENYVYLKSSDHYQLGARFFKCIDCYNYFRGGSIKTLGDFKLLLEEKGLIRNMGYKTLAHLNEALEEHGMEAFNKVRPLSYAAYHINELKRNGLEPV